MKKLKWIRVWIIELIQIEINFQFSKTVLASNNQNNERGLK